MSTLGIENLHAGAAAAVEQLGASRPGAAIAAGEPPLLLDAAAVGQALGVSVRTIRRLDLQGRLPRPVRIGRAVRWRRTELVAWVIRGCPPRLEWTWEPHHAANAARREHDFR